MSADVNMSAGSTDTVDHGKVVVRCPADGSVVGSVPAMSTAEVADLARRLRAAQPEWERLGSEGRSKWLYAWCDWILDNQDHLLRLVQLEGGKSWGDASIEALASTQAIKYFADNVASFLADKRPRPSGLPNKVKRLRVRYRPHQLVGTVMPWNYPLAMPMLDIPAALAAGAAVLSKPSEVTPLAWQAAVEGWNEIGAPPVLGCATGRGETGAAVVDHVDMIQFTGSTKTGRMVAARAGERLIPCSLELGGKDAMIVLADADLERAANGAVWGGMFNCGQSCTAIERVYVEEAVYDEFVRLVVEKTARLRQGMDAPHSFEADIGALANEAQREIVQRQVADALERGARVLTGGRAAAGEGCMYEATVLVDVDHSMACMNEETFGPTLPIMKVADQDEAVRFANDSAYGLSASIWTKDHEVAYELSQRLEVGAVNVNNAMLNVFQFPVPHSGWKDSGVGARFGGEQGVLKYCRAQAYVTDRIEAKSELQWYPYTRPIGRLQARMVNLLAARDWRRRLGRSSGR
ncbi:aldehyde dehydrogenase family protein [Sciscionella marina]|uniref:aldehyde dehydrogenase family protein n=1 Tax=Sciscionella marina TaxID=508770 RepID=UPI00058B4AEC|nr:aldehyde dehydrogenase family protein [Sciscionella marina]